MDLYISSLRKVWRLVFFEQQVRKVYYPVELLVLMEGPFSDWMGRQVSMDLLEAFWLESLWEDEDVY